MPLFTSTTRSTTSASAPSIYSGSLDQRISSLQSALAGSLSSSQRVIYTQLLQQLQQIAAQRPTPQQTQQSIQLTTTPVDYNEKPKGSKVYLLAAAAIAAKLLLFA